MSQEYILQLPTRAEQELSKQDLINKYKQYKIQREVDRLQQ